MTPNRRILVGALVLFVILLLVFRWNKVKNRDASSAVPARPAAASLTTQAPLPTATEIPASPSAQAERRRQAVEFVQSVYSAPIAFYGRVQDQHAEPVSGARVDYSILNKFFEPGSKKFGIADEKGYFSLTGVEGAALTVGVSREGYDPIYQQSNGTFAFGMPYDPQRDRPTPTIDNPAIFVLRKKTAAEPLILVRSRQYDLAKDGVPLEVNLDTGKPVAVGQGHIRVECWLSEQAKNAEGEFNWKCEVSVPGGGLLERNPEHDFEAPKDGYRTSDEIVMTINNAEQRWSSQVAQEYFVKLQKQRYGRIKLSIFVGGRTFFVLESYLNPSGSRNLEYDIRQ